MANWLLMKLGKGLLKAGKKIAQWVKKLFKRKKGKDKKRGKDKKGKDREDKQKEKERKNRERLEKAKRELPPKIDPLLRKGIWKIRLRAMLAMWRVKYRLRVLKQKKGEIVAANSPEIRLTETLSISRDKLLRLVRKIIDELLNSKEAREEEKKSEYRSALLKQRSGCPN